MDYDLPEYPHDFEELKHIDKLIKKIPEYRKKVSVLYQEITDLSKTAVKAGSRLNWQELDYLIYKSFFIDLENRSYNTNDARIVFSINAENHHYGRIKNRNISCEICSENRTIDKCHIIPARIGGTKNHPNLVYLCPTHHRLFDRFKLSKSEWAQIDWDKKSEASKQYALTDTLQYQRVFSLINVLAEGCGLPESHTDPSFPKKISSVLLSRRVI